MAVYRFGHGTPPDDEYVLALNLAGEPMIARRGEGEFKTISQIKDEIAVRQGHCDQVLKEWMDEVDRAAE
jgi:hypothetical protein